jgi:hypothetical protein
MNKRSLVFLLGCMLGASCTVLFFNKNFRVWGGNYLRSHFHGRKAIPMDVDLWNQPSSMVCLVMGQSNAANYGWGKYNPISKDIYNFHEGNLYPAQEPLLGGDGKGASVWMRVADKLIQSKRYKRVMIIKVAQGATSVNCWSEGLCKERMLQTILATQKAGFRISHVFWQQGETDNANGMSEKAYQSALGKVIVELRAKGVTAPIGIAQATYAFNKTNQPMGISLPIQQAQKKIVLSFPGLFLGPNADSIDKAYYRYEDLHFSAEGLDVLANAWLARIP